MKRKEENQTPEVVQDFRTWFQREYLRRRKKNGAYSIRAFSNYLGLSSGTTSQLMSGKRKPSVKFVQKLIQQLDITPSEADMIMSSLKRKAETERDHALQAYKLIGIDAFKLMSEWYHYAILELTAVKGFKYDHSWIAGQLQISVTESRQAVERLLRLDLVEERGQTLVKTNSFVTNGDDLTSSSAHKQFQRQLLEKGLEAIDTIALSEKDISSITMAIDETKIPEAKEKITKFRRELCQFLEKGTQTRVFNMGIQLFPLSKGRKTKLGESK